MSFIYNECEGECVSCNGRCEMVDGVCTCVQIDCLGKECGDENGLCDGYCPANFECKLEDAVRTCVEMSTDNPCYDVKCGGACNGVCDQGRCQKNDEGSFYCFVENGESSGGIPWWVWLIVGLVILFIIIIIAIILVKSKKGSNVITETSSVKNTTGTVTQSNQASGLNELQKAVSTTQQNISNIPGLGSQSVPNTNLNLPGFTSINSQAIPPPS